MTLQQLDEVLKSWRERMSRVAENLLELQTDTTYQLLSGGGGLQKADLHGVTRERVDQALGWLNELFVHFGLLQSLVDRVEALRKGVSPIFGADARLRAMERLLFTPSIELPVTEMPHQERQLLSAGETASWTSPEELLAEMVRRFGEVRGVVQSVEAAWERAGALGEQAEGELDALRRQAGQPRSLLAPALQTVEQALTAARAGIATDPLGALATFETTVHQATQGVRVLLQQGERVQTSLRAAQGRWSELQTRHKEAEVAQAALRGQLQWSPEQPVATPRETLDALHAWLNRLDRKRDEGAYAAVEVGLARWCAAAEEIDKTSQAIVDLCSMHKTMQAELRGRMEALEAKARARGLAEDEELRRLGERAATLLYTRPVDLSRAAGAVAHFEHKLSLRGPSAVHGVADPA